MGHQAWPPPIVLMLPSVFLNLPSLLALFVSTHRSKSRLSSPLTIPGTRTQVEFDAQDPHVERENQFSQLIL